MASIHACGFLSKNILIWLDLLLSSILLNNGSISKNNENGSCINWDEKLFFVKIVCKFLIS